MNFRTHFQFYEMSKRQKFSKIKYLVQHDHCLDLQQTEDVTESPKLYLVDFFTLSCAEGWAHIMVECSALFICIQEVSDSIFSSEICYHDGFFFCGFLSHSRKMLQ